VGSAGESIPPVMEPIEGPIPTPMGEHSPSRDTSCVAGRFSGVSPAIAGRPQPEILAGTDDPRTPHCVPEFALIRQW